MGKGSRREREAVGIYQQAGMATYRPATVRFGENDMFGLFDVVALSPSHSAVHAIQVKSNGANGIKAWSRHTGLFRALDWRTFYLVPYDNQGWRLIECTGPEQWIDRVDERPGVIDMGQGVVEYLKRGIR